MKTRSSFNRIIKELKLKLSHYMKRKWSGLWTSLKICIGLMQSFSKSIIGTIIH